jgi:hypothetical protein
MNCSEYVLGNPFVAPLGVNLQFTVAEYQYLVGAANGIPRP